MTVINMTEWKAARQSPQPANPWDDAAAWEASRQAVEGRRRQLQPLANRLPPRGHGWLA